MAGMNAYSSRRMSDRAAAGTRQARGRGWRSVAGRGHQGHRGQYRDVQRQARGTCAHLAKSQGASLAAKRREYCCYLQHNLHQAIHNICCATHTLHRKHRASTLTPGTPHLQGFLTKTLYAPLWQFIWTVYHHQVSGLLCLLIRSVH